MSFYRLVENETAAGVVVGVSRSPRQGLFRLNILYLVWAVWYRDGCPSRSKIAVNRYLWYVNMSVDGLVLSSRPV